MPHSKALLSIFHFLAKQVPILLGRRYIQCMTMEYKFVCPILDLLTLDVVTSTPHFSHLMPL